MRHRLGSRGIPEGRGDTPMGRGVGRTCRCKVNPSHWSCTHLRSHLRVTGKFLFRVTYRFCSSKSVHFRYLLQNPDCPWDLATEGSGISSRLAQLIAYCASKLVRPGRISPAAHSPYKSVCRTQRTRNPLLCGTKLPGCWVSRKTE